MDKKLFLEETFIERIRLLDGNALGKWGKMNGHQMAEHVIAFFKISSGGLQIPVVTAEADLPKFKAFLLSDKEFRENTKAPSQILGEEPLPTRTASMEEAVSKLERSIGEFTAYFAANPGAITTHPVFGPLNFEEWILLHYKHVLHHLKQFDLA